MPGRRVCKAGPRPRGMELGRDLDGYGSDAETGYCRRKSREGVERMIGSIFRKLRGALGTAITWGVGWALASVPVMGVLFLFSPGLSGFWGSVPLFMALGGMGGFIGGTVFSTLLGGIFGRRSFTELKPLPMAFLGCVSGVLVPLGLVGVFSLTGFTVEVEAVAGLLLYFGGMGAVTSAGMLKIAGMSQEQLEASDDPVGRIGS